MGDRVSNGRWSHGEISRSEQQHRCREWAGEETPVSTLPASLWQRARRSQMARHQVMPSVGISLLE